MSADGKGQDPKHAAGQGEISPEERESIRQRSSEIGQKLDALKAQRAPARSGARSTAEASGQAAYGEAFKYAADLIVGVGLGGVLGWALDRQFGTAPWLMILLLILGFAAGLSNVIRAARKAQAVNEALQRAAPSVTDDDDDDK
jgi:ATP synthase protein I